VREGSSHLSGDAAVTTDDGMTRLNRTCSPSITWPGREYWLFLPTLIAGRVYENYSRRLRCSVLITLPDTDKD
jgi:hypothetical protein